jgi:hypothetical protein
MSGTSDDKIWRTVHLNEFGIFPNEFRKAKDQKENYFKNPVMGNNKFEDGRRVWEESAGTVKSGFNLSNDLNFLHPVSLWSCSITWRLQCWHWHTPEIPVTCEA